LARYPRADVGLVLVVGEQRTTSTLRLRLSAPVVLDRHLRGEHRALALESA